MSAVTNLGKVSVTPKGTWANNTAYDILDIVAYQGSSYIAIQNVPSSGVPLSNTSYWLMIASKGDGGEITSASASISGGYGTPGVTVTEGGTDHEKTLAFAFTNLVGKGISSITQTTTSSVSGGTNVITCTLTDGNSTTFAILNGTDGDAINIAPAYDSTATYNLGDLVVYNDTLYECTTAIPVAEAWDSTHWTATDVSGQLSRKANIDGSYDLMNTGTSDNWTPYSADSGATQDIPFINEATGGGNGESVVDTGSYLQFKRKLGNTVGVNQLIPDSTSHNTGTGTGNWVGLADNMSMTSGHHYVVLISGKIPVGSKFRIRDSAKGWVGTEHSGSFVWTAPDNSTATTTIQFRYPSGEAYDVYRRAIDLTLWFGGNDNIPSDLLSHPENWGRYYAGSLAYNAGTLDSADGTVMRSIGRNVWDEEWEVGAYNTTTGAKITGTNVRSKNMIRVIPNTTYFFNSTTTTSALAIPMCFYDGSGQFVEYVLNSVNSTFLTPSTAQYMTFYCGVAYGSTYKTDITISLYYPGESGYDQYYPFSVLAEVDTGSEVLRGVEGSRDEKLPNGTITWNRAVVDLGTLNWTQSSGGAGKYYANLPTPYALGASVSMICGRFVFLGVQATHYQSDKAFDCYNRSSESSPNQVYFRDDSISSAAAFKAAMDGVMLEYPLATPTTEQGTVMTGLNIENGRASCNDFGSLYWTNTKGVPQGNEIFYPVDYKASFDTLYNLVEGDMSAIATDDELQEVADRVPDAPSTDGTYSLKVSVSGGTKTYSWVEDAE